jgi:sec-independent protein translocase protein TatC
VAPTAQSGPSRKETRRASRARRKEERTLVRSQMTLLEHFNELKRRLFFSAIAIAVCAVAGWFLFTPVFNALQDPLVQASKDSGIEANINFSGVATGLDFRLKVSAFIGFFIASPVWIYQFWNFINPGLTRRERGYTYGFMGVAVPLFLGGAYFAWWIMPRAVHIMTGFVPETASNLIAADTYLNFVMRLVIAFGLACAMPVLLVALNFMGMLKAATMLKAWRWAVVAAFTFAALMTPTPDALTMILVALPIVVLYFAAVGVSALHDRSEQKRLNALDEELREY